MTFIVVLFIFRKPGVSPSTFKSHYENIHIPLLQSITGSHFPNRHTRHYIQRSEDGANTAAYPATVLEGMQEDFEYDAFAELVFDDKAAFQTFFALVSQEEAARTIAMDEEIFLDRGKLKAAVVGACVTTSGPVTSA